MVTTTRLGFDDGLLTSFNHWYESQSPRVTRLSKNASWMEGRATDLATAQPGLDAVSNVFGKRKPRPPSIGHHPDFIHLKGTDETCYCPITTLFMDIESSTRLGLLYPLEDVRRIKNAFIQTAIEVVRSFDGHVHRIMGDAVMAFFGGQMCTSETGIIDGINCAAVLRYLAEQVIRPKLEAENVDHDFGVRIGLDHGPEKQVLWSSYGYPGMEEVTATSFFVDIASKLQSAAGRNQAMMGRSIIDTIGFPEDLLAIKKIKRNGESCDEPYVTPNHTDRVGNPINYAQRQLQANDYLLCTPLGQRNSTITKSLPVKPVPVTCTIHPEKESPISEGTYLPASRSLHKGKWLKFKIDFPGRPLFPYRISFIVENHGKEAWELCPEDGGNHQSDYTIKTPQEHENFSHWESTAYRGLHYLTVEVQAHGRLEFKTRFGVYVD